MKYSGSLIVLFMISSLMPVQAAPHKPLKAGLDPEAAARYMTVPDGFSVTLSAGEPMVHQPVAFTIDHRGRLWVAEAFTYPRRAPEGQGRDKIIILEDQDLDGRFETRKIFAEGLNLVSGLEVGFGGVWVGAAPYLLFFPDENADDKPDGEPRVLLDGFGYEDTHETLNAFIWGPDGWLYGCHGVFTHSRVGKPGTPDKDRQGLNCGVWRYHPTQHRFEVFAWGTSNPWGVDFNDHGHAFITACVIPHLWHIIQGARYERQGGQHFGAHVYDDIKTIATHRHYAGDIREHAWWGQEPDTPADTLAAGGGHAHCGALVYLGDNWPDSYRNQILMNNIHGNRVNMDLLARKGSGYVGSRAPDVIIANDKWFRGINLKYGPDGSVYLIDWYDRNACHRVNPEIWDRTNGRVYNVTFGSPRRKPVDLRAKSDLELVELQLHKNDWYVRMARRILHERAASGRLDSAAVSASLGRILRQNSDTSRRLRAMWTLHVTGNLPRERLVELLGDSDENIRSWAIQLLLEGKSASTSELARLADLAQNDDSQLVRLYLASALQRLPIPDRWTLAEPLLQHSQDASDHNLPLMYWYGIEPLVETDIDRSLHLATESQIPLVTEFIYRRLGYHPTGIARLIASIDARQSDLSLEHRRIVLQQISKALAGQARVPMPESWNTVYDQLRQADDSEIRELADRIAIVFGDRRVLPRMRQVLTDQTARMSDRQAALEILVRGNDNESAKAIRAVLDVPELRAQALRALGTLDDPETPQAIIAIYTSLIDTEKRDAVATLTTRPAYAMALLDAVSEGKIPRNELHAYDARQIYAFNDSQLQDRLRKVWGEIRSSSADKQRLIDEYKTILLSDAGRKPQPGHGRQIFARTCATCHRMFGEGDTIGPDITGSNRANIDYILENVVDPSAVLGNDYRMTVLQLADGRSVSGLIQSETDSAVTIRTLNDTLVVAKADIDVRQLSDLSMMPEALLNPLNHDEIRDLIAYLQSPAQVPISGPPAPIDPKTGRVDGAIEGESMKVQAVSAGSVSAQSMSSFSADRWSSNSQLWWTGAKPGAKLELPLAGSQSGPHELELVLTRAPDYGVVQIWLGDVKLGEPIDLYNPQVVTTGLLTFPLADLDGQQTLTLEIVGANSHAIKSYMVGLDFVRLRGQ
jgi:putative membrane-bound dehydrogenase-like protein